MYIYIYNGKWSPMRFSLIHLPFAHRANGSCVFYLLTKRQTEVIRLKTDFTY